MFRRLAYINGQLYQVHWSNPKLNTKKQYFSDFFILQYAKLRILEIYYNFFDNLCGFAKFEELEMDTASLYRALSEHDLYDCIRPTTKQEWNSLQSGDSTENFSVNSTTIFFPRTCCTKHKKHDKRELDLCKEKFRCTELSCLWSKTYCCYDFQSNKFKFSSRGLNRRPLEDCGVGHFSRCDKVLEEVVNVTSAKRGFRTIKHAVATNEQMKKGLSYFFPKRKVQRNGIHTQLFNI